MPRKKTTAAEYLARGRIKSSGIDKDIVNGEEVKKELAISTQRSYELALRLWNQYINRADTTSQCPN
jgi:hypothetical protein